MFVGAERNGDKTSLAVNIVNLVVFGCYVKLRIAGFLLLTPARGGASASNGWEPPLFLGASLQSLPNAQEI